MALNQSTRNPRQPRWHFLVRLVGLTGLLVVGLGLGFFFLADVPLGLLLLIVGGVLAGLTLLSEILRAMQQVTGQRGARGGSVAGQIVLALILVGGLNVFSFAHYLRWDCTRDALFTIPDDLRDKLSRLQGQTTIVLHLRHVTAGQLSEKLDEADAAAERKVVEKVKDLAEQFQELGPRFKVWVLDVQEHGYQDKLAEATRGSEELRTAIEKTPENSIFFFADGKVQHLGFDEIYQLDKKASAEANNQRGNLVLNYQGVGPFARKILSLEEKKPRVAAAVIHEILGMDSTESEEEWGMNGLKKVLAAHGFEGTDLILKKWGEMGPPEPSVLTYAENKFERLEEQINELEQSIKAQQEDLKEITKQIDFWKNAPIEELNKKYGIVDTGEEVVLVDRQQLDKLKKAGRKFRELPVGDEVRQQFVRRLEPNLLLRQMALKQDQGDRDALLKDKQGLNVENLTEMKRIADLRAKMNRLLADVDLLLVPRLTLKNVTREYGVPNRVHRLEEAQIAAIKEFMKVGKPVLFCLGPANEPPGRFDPTDMQPDQLEIMLSELGVKLPKQTILFNVESKAFAERRSGLVILGTQVEVPPVEFEWPAGEGQVGQLFAAKARPEHPVRTSLRLTSRSLGKGQALEMRLRHPRPVYLDVPEHKQLPYDPIIMMTNPEAWNEEQPFPSRERTPRFERPKDDDPARGTINEKRRGRFPIGVALETTVPPSWYGEKEGSPAKVRLAVIGHGGVFSGQSLNPTKEKLFLDVANWLLGRDDLLARDNLTWEYPRVSLGPTAKAIWQWGLWLGLPLLVVYLGMIMWLVRGLR